MSKPFSSRGKKKLPIPDQPDTSEPNSMVGGHLPRPVGFLIKTENTIVMFQSDCYLNDSVIKLVSPYKYLGFFLEEII